MKSATCKDFISIISEEKPPLVLFRYKNEKPEFMKILKDLLKGYPLLNSYEYIIDESEDNQILAEHLEVETTPVLVFYKNGNFNRYKDKHFSKKTLSLFLGSKKNYALVEDNKKHDNESAEDSAINNETI